MIRDESLDNTSILLASQRVLNLLNAHDKREIRSAIWDLFAFYHINDEEKSRLSKEDQGKVHELLVYFTPNWKNSADYTDDKYLSMIKAKAKEINDIVYKIKNAAA